LCGGYFSICAMADAADAAARNFPRQASGKRGKRFLHLNRALAALAAEWSARTKEFQTDQGIEEFR
jgi:hypothetical protein